MHNITTGNSMDVATASFSWTASLNLTRDLLTSVANQTSTSNSTASFSYTETELLSVTTTSGLEILTDFTSLLVQTVTGTTLKQVESALDTDPVPKWCKVFDFINYSVILGSVCIFGLLGNTLAQFTLWPDRKTNPTSFLLIMLAVFDNVVLVIHFLGKLVPSVYNYYDVSSPYMDFVQPTIKAGGWVIAHLAQMSSAWTIVIISFGRYIAVCRPHDTQKYVSMKKVKLMLVVMFLANVIYYSPRMGQRKLIYDEKKHKYNVKTLDYTKSVVYMVYDIPVFYILMFLVPFTLLVIMTYFQIRALRESQKRREKISKTKRDEKDVTITLIVVVLVFMLCQMWEPVRRLISVVGANSNSKDCSKLLYHGSSLKTFFATFNSACNFVIYYVCGRRFRRQFVRRVFRRNDIYPTTSAAPDKTSTHVVGTDRLSNTGEIGV